MKLVLQIAMGVFLGVLTSQLLLDQWHFYQERQVAEAEHQKLAAREKARNERDQRAREILMGQLQGKVSGNMPNQSKNNPSPQNGDEAQTAGMPPMQ